MIETAQHTDPAMMARLANLELVARCCVEGFLGGKHPSPFHGFSVEYSDHRDYRPGDEPRYIDWKALGRSDRLYVKQFRHETNTTIHLLLDSSSSMAFSSGEVSKFRYGCFISAALAYLAVRQGDAVSLGTFSEKFNSRISGSPRKSHLGLLYRALEKTVPQGRTDLAGVLHNFSDTVTRRGLVVIISDFLDGAEEFKKALSHLRRRRHDVILMQTLDPRELLFDYSGAVEIADMESGESVSISAAAMRPRYLRNLENFLADLRLFCGRNEIDYTLVNIAEPLEKTLLSYLGRRKTMM
jgi:uncharacterized protein (DUF58 family)